MRPGGDQVRVGARVVNAGMTSASGYFVQVGSPGCGSISRVDGGAVDDVGERADRGLWLGTRSGSRIVGSVITALRFTGGSWSQVMSYDTELGQHEVHGAGRVGIEFKTSTSTTSAAAQSRPRRRRRNVAADDHGGGGPGDDAERVGRVLDRHARTHVHVRVGPLRQRGEQLRPDRECNDHELHARAGRRRVDHPFPGYWDEHGWKRGCGECGDGGGEWFGWRWSDDAGVG